VRAVWDRRRELHDEMRIGRAQDRHLVRAAEHRRRAGPEVLPFEHELFLRAIERGTQHQELPVLLLTAVARTGRSLVGFPGSEQDDQGGDYPSACRHGSLHLGRWMSKRGSSPAAVATNMIKKRRGNDLLKQPGSAAVQPASVS
jgi:hypothetical protein